MRGRAVATRPPRRSPDTPPPTDRAVTTRVRTIVFGEGDVGIHCGRRSARSLGRAGVVVEDGAARSTALGEALLSAADPVWLVRAGAWLPRRGPVSFPPPSRTRRPLCALGAIGPLKAALDDYGAGWAEPRAATGGDLDGSRLAPLPPLASVFLEPALAGALGARLAGGEALPGALETVLRHQRARVVRYAPLDVHADRALRVAQVVTSLQHGGAERAALSLAPALPRQGRSTLLVALGGPTRASFEIPPDTLDLPWERHLDRQARVAPLLDALSAFGADVVHAHLLDAGEVRRLGASGLPLG